MSEEEKEAIQILKDWLCKTHSEFCKVGAIGIPDKEFFATETVLNLIEKLQKENEELRKFILEGITIENSPFQNYQLDILRENFIPIWRIKNLIKELKQDDINMTRKYKEKKNITGELLGIDKVRVRAYREKTREINEKLHKLLSD